MRAAAATNRVTLPAQSLSQQHAGITVNDAIPVAGVEAWKREAIQKVIGFVGLAPNWDSYGSQAPSLAVRQTAIELLLSIPGGEWLPVPRIVPVSGGGFHFEWSVGEREVEISVEPNCRIEALRVEHGMPIEDDSSNDLPALFGWLSSR
jgi:hypothetical protein